MTIKTWCEAAECAAKAAYERSVEGGLRWEGSDPATKYMWRDEMDAALRAIRAAGVVMVPREITRDIAAAIELTDEWDDAMDAGEQGYYVVQYAPIWRAAIAAGEIKPEGE